MYLDVADSAHVPSSESARDVVEIRRRVGTEGITFLTRTLNLAIGRPLDRALAGDCSQLTFPGFERTPGKPWPKLFRSLFELVFEPCEGLRDSVPSTNIRLRTNWGESCCSTAAISALRQISNFYWKLEIPFTESQATKVVEDFVAVDNDLPRTDGVLPWHLVCLGRPIDSGEIRSPSEGYVDSILLEARRMVTDIFHGGSRQRVGLHTQYTDSCGRFDHVNIRPKHGPGAVATGERAHEKHVFKRIYRQIEQVYPFTEYFEFNLTAVADRYHKYESLEELDSGTAKVVLVPKDSRGPRLISCEPLEYQWIQQGLGNKIRDFLEVRSITSGHVNFRDQSVNRRLALEGSRLTKEEFKDQQWVTLDMKEASDRVSLALVEFLFGDCPELLQALLACRTPVTCLPDGSLHKMNKFAPMGSNLCFPVEALVFYVLAVASIVYEYKVTRREARSRVFVYGDDIIVTRKYHAALLQYFPFVGLAFNEDKCCIAGSFRESCGMDAYLGVDVTPLRKKRIWSRNPLDPEASYSYVALGNAAAKRGYHRIVSRLVTFVHQRLGPLPITSSDGPESSGLCWRISDSLVHLGTPVSNPTPCSSLTGEAAASCFPIRFRFNRRLHRLEALTWQAAPRLTTVFADDWCMVLRRFTTPSERDEPGSFAVPRCSRLKRGWTQVAL